MPSLAVVTPLVALTALVWAADDGERVPRDATITSTRAPGDDNPIWRPGQPIRLFGLRDEVVAFQVVVEGPADGVRVDLEGLDPAISVDRFVEPFFEVRRSTTKGSDTTLGWSSGSGPAPGSFVGWQPDALIPIDVAPPWAPWPMKISAGQNGVVWIDLTIPRDFDARQVHGKVVARSSERVLETIPLELEVLNATLPARPVRTWLFYDRSDLAKRVGHLEASEPQLLTLLHRHRVTGFDSVDSVEDVRRALPALDGSLYGAARGYRGPAAGIADDLVVLGTYGTLGEATATQLRRVEAIADQLTAHAVFDRAEVVLYAEDERCDSGRGAAWRALLASSLNPNARRVRVAWTCSEEPAHQPVDVPIVFAGDYDSALAAAARGVGKETWIYNGYRPATGALLTDAGPVDLRTFGWIAALGDIPRWFIWNANAWYDANRGGHGPFDPFVSAATGHNDSEGSELMGDGVLVYPGRQIDRFTEHSLGIDGVVPSIRLKSLRRGIEDAGYYQLARSAAGDAAEAIGGLLFPRILAEARFEDPVSWDERPAAFFRARRALAQLIAPGADPGPRRIRGAGPRPKDFHLRRRYQVAIGMLLAVALWVAIRRRRRRTLTA